MASQGNMKRVALKTLGQEEVGSISGSPKRDTLSKYNSKLSCRNRQKEQEPPMAQGPVLDLLKLEERKRINPSITVKVPMHHLIISSGERTGLIGSRWVSLGGNQECVSESLRTSKVE